MTKPTPLIAYLFISLIGGSALSLALLSFGFGPLLSVFAYSLGGIVTLMIVAFYLSKRLGADV